jgi:hypothetical protein
MTTREKVDQLESELKVEDLKVNAFGKSFQLYPWLKGRLFHKMITGHETMQKRDLKLYLKQLGSVFYGLHNLFRKYDVWAFSSSVERRKVNEKYYDKLFDFIGNETGKKMLLIETRIFVYHRYRDIASKYAISRSFFMLFEELYGRLFVRNPNINDQDLLRNINSKVEGGVDHRTIIRKYLAQYRLMKFWLRILPNPKVVFVSVGYTCFGYIKAFKEKGIKVVEVQHGVITGNHHAYYYKKEFDQDQFPDFLLTNGKKELSVFDDSNKFPVKKVIPVGSFIIDHYSEKLSSRPERNKPMVLFALQDGVMGDKLIEFILELKNKGGEHLQILVQPRRNQKEFYLNRYPDLIDVDFSTEDFYTSVVKADLHCTVYSTTAIESLSLGVPNILVNIDNQSIEQLGTVLGSNPYTKVVENTEDFLNRFKSLIDSDPELIKKSNEENIMVNYKENITSFIKNNC